MNWLKKLLIGAAGVLAIAGISESSGDKILTARSAGGEYLAYAVRRGDVSIPITEIWIASQQDNSARKIAAYPGEPGGLSFDPDGSALISLERSLRREAWGSYFYGGQSLPITRNRIRKLSLDGTREETWPLPDDFQTPRICAFSRWKVVGDDRVSGKSVRAHRPRRLGRGRSRRRQAPVRGKRRRPAKLVA